MRADLHTEKHLSGIKRATFSSYDIDMPKVDIRDGNIHMTAEGHKAQITDFGIFHNEKGCFVHTMLLNRQFKIDALTDMLVKIKKQGENPQEYLSYALQQIGLDEDEELSDLEIEQIVSAVDRAGRW